MGGVCDAQSAGDNVVSNAPGLDTHDLGADWIIALKDNSAKEEEWHHVTKAEYEKADKAKFEAEAFKKLLKDNKIALKDGHLHLNEDKVEVADGEGDAKVVLLKKGAAPKATTDTADPKPVEGTTDPAPEPTNTAQE